MHIIYELSSMPVRRKALVWVYKSSTNKKSVFNLSKNSSRSGFVISSTIWYNSSSHVNCNQNSGKILFYQILQALLYGSYENENFEIGFANSRWKIRIGKLLGKRNFPFGNLGKSGNIYLLFKTWQKRQAELLNLNIIHQYEQSDYTKSKKSSTVGF